MADAVSEERIQRALTALHRGRDEAIAVDELEGEPGPAPAGIVVEVVDLDQVRVLERGERGELTA